MTNDLPTPRERSVLAYMYRYRNNHGVFPSPNEIKDGVDIDAHNTSTIIGRLKKKGYLQRQRGNPIPTNKAEQYFNSTYEVTRPHNIVPTQVVVAGTVQAGGNVKPDELEVNITDEYDDSSRVIIIPATHLDKKTYALEVVGYSMEHEGIREGDYVIVEEYDITERGISPGDMIVTKYYPLDMEQQEGTNDDVLEADYFGLTLKIVMETKTINGRQSYRLGWKKDNRSNPYLIWASRLIPKGKVIGVYRNLKGDKLNRRW
jgi:SOS-response transcriptional repressor LexA